MHRLTNVLFWISDVLAWLLLAFALFAAVTYPIAGPIRARMDDHPLPTSSIVVTCLLWLTVAVGAYLITRRRALGIALTVAPVLAASPQDALSAGLMVASTLALVFGLPFLLVLVRSCSRISGSAP